MVRITLLQVLEPPRVRERAALVRLAARDAVAQDRVEAVREELRRAVLLEEVDAVVGHVGHAHLAVESARRHVAGEDEVVVVGAAVAEELRALRGELARAAANRDVERRHRPVVLGHVLERDLHHPVRADRVVLADDHAAADVADLGAQEDARRDRRDLHRRVHGLVLAEERLRGELELGDLGNLEELFARRRAAALDELLGVLRDDAARGEVHHLAALQERRVKVVLAGRQRRNRERAVVGAGDERRIHRLLVQYLAVEVAERPRDLSLPVRLAGRAEADLGRRARLDLGASVPDVDRAASVAVTEHLHHVAHEVREAVLVLEDVLRQARPRGRALDGVVPRARPVRRQRRIAALAERAALERRTRELHRLELPVERARAAVDELDEALRRALRDLDVARHLGEGRAAAAVLLDDLRTLEHALVEPALQLGRPRADARADEDERVERSPLLQGALELLALLGRVPEALVEVVAGDADRALLAGRGEDRRLHVHALGELPGVHLAVAVHGDEDLLLASRERLRPLDDVMRALGRLERPVRELAAELRRVRRGLERDRTAHLALDLHRVADEPPVAVV